MHGCIVCSTQLRLLVWTEGTGQVSSRMPADLQQFLVDFLPSEQRVLQRDGLHLFHIRYWSDELRWLMGEGSSQIHSEI